MLDNKKMSESTRDESLCPVATRGRNFAGAALSILQYEFVFNSPKRLPFGRLSSTLCVILIGFDIDGKAIMFGV